MNALPAKFFRCAVCYGLLGMILGIYMAMSGNHDLYPAHAHINLLGWVSMAIYGLFYHAFPAATEGKTAAIQFWSANAGTVLLGAGVFLIYSGRPEMEPLAAVGSIITLLSMALFAFLAFRRT